MPRRIGRLRPLVAAAGCIALLVQGGAGAATPKSVVLTEYLHGTSTLGELDENQMGTTYLPMSPAKPTGSTPRSINLTSLGLAPDPSCAGSHNDPVWIVAATGSLAGRPTVTVRGASTSGMTATQGGGVEIRLYADVTKQICQGTALGAPPPPDPIAATTTTMPVAPGTLTVSLDLLKKHPAFKHNLMLQFTPVLAPIYTSRIFYDAADYASSLVFTCTPATGRRTC